MRRLLAGATVFVASVAVPATFHGTAFLIAVWLALALLGAALILTSEPVKRRWVAALARELGSSAPPPPATAAPAPSRAAMFHELMDELETTLRRVRSAQTRGSYRRNFTLPSAEWERHRAQLAREVGNDVRRLVAQAYVEADHVTTAARSRAPSLAVDQADGLPQAARAVRAALDALNAALSAN